MKSRFVSDPTDLLGNLKLGWRESEFLACDFFFLPPTTPIGKRFPPVRPPAMSSSLTPTLPAESVEAQARPKWLRRRRFRLRRLRPAAALPSISYSTPPRWRRRQIFRGRPSEQAASILSATITNKITVNINIDYSGTGGGGRPPVRTMALFENYSTVRSDLISNAAPGDTTFNALPTGSTIQGQSKRSRLERPN